MAFETIHLMKRVQFEADTDGVMTFEFKTDQPGDSFGVRFTQTFNTDATSTRRRTIDFRLPGGTKGKLYIAKVYGVNVGRLYGGRILARPLGAPGAAGWSWYPMDIRATPEPYAVAQLPIRPTAEMYAVAQLPLRATAEDFADALLPIRATKEIYDEGPLPIPPTPLVPRWYDIPVDFLS